MRKDIAIAAALSLVGGCCSGAAVAAQGPADRPPPEFRSEALASLLAFDRPNELPWEHYALLGAIVSLLVVMLRLYRNDRRDRSAHRREMLLHQQRVKELLVQRTIPSMDPRVRIQEEEERARITRDLRQQLAEVFSGIKLHFSALEERLSGMEAQQKLRYRGVFHLLDDTLAEVGRLGLHLVRGTIVQFGLVSALEDLRSAIIAPGRLQVELKTFGLSDRLETRFELTVYRMVQELVSTALQRSRPDHLSILLTRRAAQLNLIVEDNGLTSGPVTAEGLGGVHAWAGALSGAVQVDHRPARGTSVSVDIPLA